MSGRRDALLVVALIGLLGGCLGIVNQNPSDIQEYDHVIEISNGDDRTHELTIEISGDGGGQTYKQFTRSIQPYEERTLRPFGDLADTDRDSFVVTFRSGTETTEATAGMNKCFGPLFLEIDGSGELAVSRAMC